MGKRSLYRHEGPGGVERENAGWQPGLFFRRSTQRVEVAGGDAVDAVHHFGSEDEVGGLQAFLELFEGGGAEDGRGDEVVLLAPGEAKGHEAESGFVGEILERRDGGEALFVDEAPGHDLLTLTAVLDIVGEAGAFREGTVEVFAGADAAAERRVGKQADFFAAADFDELVLEAAVKDGEVVLNRL